MEQVKPSEAHRSSPVTLVDKFSLRKLVFEVGVGSKPLPIMKANASSEKMICSRSGGWRGGSWDPLPGERYSLSEQELAFARAALAQPQWTGCPAMSSRHGEW